MHSSARVTVDRVSSAVPSDDYFLEIEGHFAARRGTPFILSAKDWVLMKKWRDDGVPLPIVLEAIDSVFEKNEASGRRKVINSLSYCRHAVKELWTERKELFVGADDGTPEEQPGPRLERLAAAVEAADGPREVLRQAAAEIRGLAAEKTVPRIEERLIEVEHDLIQRALRADAEAAAQIREEVERAIGNPAKLDEKTRARTEEANLRRIVRARFGLPRLTLFG